MQVENMYGGEWAYKEQEGVCSTQENDLQVAVEKGDCILRICSRRMKINIEVKEFVQQTQEAT